MTSVPDTVQKNVILALERIHNRTVNLKKFSFIGGGCINNGGRLTTSEGDYFIKWNSSERYPKMFEAEATGLTLLKKSTHLHVPEVIGWFEAHDYQGILLEFVEFKAKASSYWSDLGRGLAALHKNSSKSFGLDHSNYIGSLPQNNEMKSSWIEFFIENRISFQLKLALDQHLLDQSVVRSFEKLYNLLPSLLPVEEPALVHGDLWSGNVILDHLGAPCLIDPAVHYGNRESEIAFTQLFGGFDELFYNSYHEAFKLQNGFQQRADLYNLYPLLVHVNLFGGGYVQQVKSILKKFD